MFRGHSLCNEAKAHRVGTEEWATISFTLLTTCTALTSSRGHWLKDSKTTHLSLPPPAVLPPIFCFVLSVIPSQRFPPSHRPDLSQLPRDPCIVLFTRTKPRTQQSWLLRRETWSSLSKKVQYLSLSLSLSLSLFSSFYPKLFFTRLDEKGRDRTTLFYCDRRNFRLRENFVR